MPPDNHADGSDQPGGPGQPEVTPPTTSGSDAPPPAKKVPVKKAPAAKKAPAKKVPANKAPAKKVAAKKAPAKKIPGAPAGADPGLVPSDTLGETPPVNATTKTSPPAVTADLPYELMERLIGGAYHDPHGVLGAHPAGDKVVVRTLRPNALS